MPVMVAPTRSVAVAGLGSIGLRVARAIDSGTLPGWSLSAVAASSRDRASAAVAGFRNPPPPLDLEDLAGSADILVECLPPEHFPSLAESALARPGLVFVVASVGALLVHEDFIDRARSAGIRMILPSGALAGLDALRAGREIGLEEVRLVTRKPPKSFGNILGTPEGEATAVRNVFSGSAREAARAFPKNMNVAATVALAGLGPDRTQVEVWADPSVMTNTHELQVRSRGGSASAVSVNHPDPDNPRSSAITAYSLLAAMRRLDEPVSIGS